MLYQWPIIGHAKQLEALEQDIKNQSIASAYLFAGPLEIGKFPIARIFAQILQCPDHFCRDCLTCKHIEKRCHVDTIELKDDGQSIKIEQIRGLIANLSLSTQSRYKIVLMENCERLTVEAANCLLKTLEEPAKNVIFLLTSGQLKDVLPTIISRTRLLLFTMTNEPQLKAKLMEFFPEASLEKIDKCLVFSLAKSARAIKLLKDQNILNWYEKIYELVYDVLEKPSLAHRFACVESIQAEPAQLDLFLQLLQYRLRQLLLARLQIQPVNDSSVAYDPATLINLLKLTATTRSLLKQNVNSRLVLENLMLQL